MRKHKLVWAVSQLVFIFLLGYAWPANAIVDMKNANYADTWTDFPGQTLADLRVGRTYNSRSLYHGIFGFGWCSDFETRLDITAEGNANLVHGGNGLEELFTAPGFSRREIEAMADRIVERAKADWNTRNVALIALLGGVGESGWGESRRKLISDDGLRARFARKFGFSMSPRDGTEFMLEGHGVSRLKFGGGEYRLEWGDGRVNRFDAEGRLVADTDRDGRTARLSYAAGHLKSVTNERGERLDFAFLPNGKVGSVILNRSGKPEGTSEYQYSDRGDLISIKNVWGNVYTYEYDDFHNLTRINFPDKTDKRIAYNKKRDWVVSFRNRDGCVEEYAYESDPTNPKNHFFSKVLKMCRGEKVNNSTYEFMFEADSSGKTFLRRVITTVNGHTTDMIYHEIHGKPVRIVRDDVEVAFNYYPNGLVRTRQNASTLREYFYVHNMTIPERIVEKELTSGDPKSWTTLFRYDGRGRIVGVERTDGLRVDYLRGEEGRITDVVFGDGRKLLIEKYDTNYVQPAEIRAPGHGTIRIEYAGKHMVKAVTSVEGEDVAQRVYGWLEIAMDLADPLGESELPRLISKAKPPVAPVDVSPFLARYIGQRSAGDYLAAHRTLSEWDMALSRAGEQKERLSVGTIALMLGTELLVGEGYKAADPLLALAYEIYRSLNLDGVMQALDAIAEMRTGQGRHAEAATVLQEGIDRITKRSGSNSPDLLPWLEKLGESYRRLGQYAKAYDTIEQARTIARVSGKSMQITDSALAELYFDVGLFQQAMAFYRKQGPAGLDELEKGNFHFTIASLFSTMGEPQKAIDILAPHLAYAEKELGPNHQDVGRLLGQLGLYYAFAGRYEQAYTALDRANKIFEKTPRTRLLNDMGILQSKLGRHVEALALYDRSLAIDSAVKKLRDVDLEATLVNMAITKSDLGWHSEAQKDLARALQIQRAAYPPGHWKIGNTQYWLAEVTRRSGDVDSASKILEESAIILEGTLGTSHARLARTLRVTGEIRLERGSLEQALASLQRSYEVALRSGDPEEVWRVQHRLSQVAARRGAPALAVLLGKQSVNGLQGLRQQMMGLDPTLQRSFLGEREQPYRDLADILIGQGRLVEAQQVISMLKEEEHFNFIRRDAAGDVRKTQAVFTGQEPLWMRRYLEISGQLVTLGRRLDDLKQKQKLDLSADERAELTRLTVDAGVARQAFVAFQNELWKESMHLDGERREALAKHKSDFKALDNYKKDLRSLEAGAVMLHYVVLTDKIHIILTTPTTQVSRSIAIEERVLNKQIMGYLRALQPDPSSSGGKLRRDPRPLGRELYKVLIEPVEEDLRQARASTLILSLDASLRYVPFAALIKKEGKEDRYLVEDYRLVLFTNAAGWRPRGKAPSPDRLVALGVTRKVDPKFDALPSVQEELKGILSAATVPGESYLDEAFTAEQVHQSVTQPGRLLIHLSTHFELNPGPETDSFMLLGDGSRLTLDQIRQAGYDFGNVELLTLSACQTAVGGSTDGNGREIDGLGVSVQDRGARAVIATLWSVADASTAEFMRQFYRLKFTAAGIENVEALRQAQLAFIRGGQTVASKNLPPGADPAKPYTHPFFWAPFILMGNL